MSWRRRALAAARRSGVNRLVAAGYGRRRLTVLGYHRVIDASVDGFDTLAGNVSATPEAFARQMEWLTATHTVISLDDLVEAVEAGSPLPHRAALVTFDDGYRDNHRNALPVLRRLRLPAVLFAATDHIGTAEPFYWDLVAWSFVHAPRRPDALPLLESTDGPPQVVATTWVERAKRLRHGEMQAMVAELVSALGVTPGDHAFDDLLLSWEEVGEMASHGVAVGAHTCSHPILTRVSVPEARHQLRESRRTIEEALGSPVLSFAYPNGLEGDYDEAVVSEVAEAGFRVAFTLRPGPARAGEVVGDPLTIRRVYVDRRDHIDRFMAKVSGLGRVAAWLS